MCAKTRCINLACIEGSIYNTAHSAVSCKVVHILLCVSYSLLTDLGVMTQGGI